jgi:UDP-N-acetylmuramoyl-L-alanyl-D-glutamate--2,6-diaminopimelate ligase
VPGRLERVNRGQSFTAIVDYAHTSDAVENILAALRAHATGRIIAVLGCGGDRDPGKRPLMGAALARGSDIAFLTSDNPRSEDPYKIISQMAVGAHGIAGSDVRIEADRATAISMAVDLAEPGDIVLVAGKGHEQGQEIMGEIKPFDDREVLAHAIDRRLAAGDVG